MHCELLSVDQNLERHLHRNLSEVFRDGIVYGVMSRLIKSS